MQRNLSSSSASGGPHPGAVTPTSPRRTLSAASSASNGNNGGPHAPPNLQSTRRTGSGMVAQPSVAQSQLSQNMVKSMTIEQMRELHQRALSEAEAKRTELRLVLASRYRELVGSSDEVIKMKELSQELHDLVHALPQLMEKAAKGTGPARGEEKEQQVENDEETGGSAVEDHAAIRLRRELSILPRVIHRALDSKDVYKASVSLIQLFTLIASQTDVYPLANALSTTRPCETRPEDIPSALEAQMRMIFLQVQTLPDKIRRMSTRILARAASYGNGVDEPAGRCAIQSAAALASLDFLETEKKEDRADRLLNTYFEAKAKLLLSLLGKLTTDEGPATTNAEEILSKIVLILQHDVVVHPYQIFVIRKFSSEEGDRIMSTLPFFDKEIVKAKCSKCVQLVSRLAAAFCKSF